MSFIESKLYCADYKRQSTSVFVYNSIQSVQTIGTGAILLEVAPKFFRSVNIKVANYVGI